MCRETFKGRHIAQTQQKVNEYDQEIPQSYTADQHTALLGRTTEHLVTMHL